VREGGREGGRGGGGERERERRAGWEEGRSRARAREKTCVLLYVPYRYIKIHTHAPDIHKCLYVYTHLLYTSFVNTRTDAYMRNVRYRKQGLGFRF
jgi:hypothetical protein